MPKEKIEEVIKEKRKNLDLEKTIFKEKT